MGHANAKGNPRQRREAETKGEPVPRNREERRHPERAPVRAVQPGETPMPKLRGRPGERVEGWDAQIATNPRGLLGELSLKRSIAETDRDGTMRKLAEYDQWLTEDVEPYVRWLESLAGIALDQSPLPPRRPESDTAAGPPAAPPDDDDEEEEEPAEDETAADDYPPADASAPPSVVEPVPSAATVAVSRGSQTGVLD